MKKTYILKDQGKGTVTNLPIEKIVEISGSSSSNGGGSATGDFIPLAGTEENKPITGKLYYETNNPNIKIYTGSQGLDRYATYVEDSILIGGSFFRAYPTMTEIGVFTPTPGEDVLLRLSTDGALLYDQKNRKGLEGSEDFSANLTPLHYTQKSYVDSKAGIPYTGTEEGKNIEGDINFLLSRNINGISGSGTSGNGKVGLSSKGYPVFNYNDGVNDFTSLLNNEGFLITDENTGNFLKLNPNSGIVSQDISDVEPENKLIYAQRAYVDSKAGIPLTGTEEGKNISGPLKFDNLNISSEKTITDGSSIFSSSIRTALLKEGKNFETSSSFESKLATGSSEDYDFSHSTTSLNTSGSILNFSQIEHYDNFGNRTSNTYWIDISSDDNTETKFNGVIGGKLTEESALTDKHFVQKAYVDSKISAASGNSYTTEEVATGGVYEFYDMGVDFDGTFPFPNAELVRKPIYRRTVIISGDDLANLNGAPLINYFPGMGVLCPFRDVIIAGTGVGYVRKVYYGMNNEFCSVQIDTDPMGNNIISFKDSTGAVKDITQCKMITITLEYTKEGSIVPPTP